VKETAHAGDGEGTEPKEFTIQFSPDLISRLVGPKTDSDSDSGTGTESQDTETGKSKSKSKGVLQSAEIAREKAIEVQTSEEILDKVNSIIFTTNRTTKSAKDNENKFGVSVFEACSDARKTYLDCLNLNIDSSICGDAMKAYANCVSTSKSK